MELTELKIIKQIQKTREILQFSREMKTKKHLVIMKN